MTITANGKRQTAIMELLPSLFSFVYSRVKLFVFAMNSRRRYSIFVCFIYGQKKRTQNQKLSLPFADRAAHTKGNGCLLVKKYNYVIKYNYSLSQ